jgi:hypothetical protein
MTTIQQEIAEFRIALGKKKRKHEQYFGIACVAFSGFLTAAYLHGSNDGWPWLLLAVFSLFCALFQLIEARHSELISSNQGILASIEQIKK